LWEKGVGLGGVSGGKDKNVGRERATVFVEKIITHSNRCFSDTKNLEAA
jgi:hypothetical protein